MLENELRSCHQFCYGSHAIFSSLWIWGNVTYRGGAQIFPRTTLQWRMIRRLKSRRSNQVGRVTWSCGHPVAKHQQAMRRYHAWNVHSRNFLVGDFVLWMIQMSKDWHKLSPTWEGPYKVVQVTWLGSYRLQREDSSEVPNSWNDDQSRPFYM
jgi:hypothetical protein